MREEKPQAECQNVGVCKAEKTWVDFVLIGKHSGTDILFSHKNVPPKRREENSTVSEAKGKKLSFRAKVSVLSPLNCHSGDKCEKYCTWALERWRLLFAAAVERNPLFDLRLLSGSGPTRSSLTPYSSRTKKSTKISNAAPPKRANEWLDARGKNWAERRMEARTAEQRRENAYISRYRCVKSTAHQSRSQPPKWFSKSQH